MSHGEHCEHWPEFCSRLLGVANNIAREATVGLVT